MTKIDELNPAIAAAHPQWKKNRDVLAGKTAVVSQTELYLPRLPMQTKQDYNCALKTVNYFPGSRRTLEGSMGLIFRKPFSFEGPEGFEDIFETITADYNLEQLARKLAEETHITNYSGLLVDHPAQPDQVSLADAISLGHRPFLALYTAENIIDVKVGLVRNRRYIVSVRLYDDADNIRELRLDKGVYTVTLHKRTSDGWEAGDTVTPLKNGAPIDHIPFNIVSTNSGYLPGKAQLDDLCELNLDLYRSQARLANILNYSASPIRYIANLDERVDELPTGVNQMWQFTTNKNGAEVKVGISEYSGAATADLRTDCETLKNEMAMIGSRILSGEKAAAEAAETLAIRRASENSTLAALANAVSDHIEKALNFAMEWMGADEISFALNTDFLPMPLDAQMFTATVAAIQSGAISHETGFKILQAGEIVPDTLDYEEERARIANDTADRPPVDTDGVGE